MLQTRLSVACCVNGSMTAVAGSGGGYLSNEISYRTLRVNAQSGARVPMGHVHTPRLEGYDPAFEWRVVEQIRAMIVAAGSASTAD